MDTKKVVFVFGGLPHYYNYILNLIHRLPGYEVTVIHPSSSQKALGKNVHEAKDNIEFNLYGLPEYTGVLGKPNLKGLRGALREIKPDILVMGFPYILYVFLNPFFFWFLRRNGIKLIEKTIPYGIPKFHEAKDFYRDESNFLGEDLLPVQKVSWKSDLLYMAFTALRRFYLPKVDAFVCYVEDAFEILGSYGVPRNRIFITYNSPDTQILFKAAERILSLPPLLPANKQRIIHVGRLVKWKKTHLLIQILPELARQFPDIELVVVGDGPELKNLQDQAEQLGVSQRVQFVGKVYNPDDLGRYLHESGIYVLGGVGGLSINDAMCFGKPVVCSVCDGTEKKLVYNGRNGFIFENDNTEDLKNKITQILSNPALMEQMGQHSLEIIKNEINENIVIKGYQKAFDFVLQR